MSARGGRAVPAAVAVAIGAALSVGGLALAVRPASAGAVTVPAPLSDPASSARSATAVFAGGCFWGVQGVFQRVRGVTATRAGYDGGPADTATYEQVSTGTTGHRESVLVTFDPQVVSYGTLLRVFFSVVINPTDRAGQFPDYGTQYRSAVITTDPGQRAIATAYIRQLDRARVFGAPVATAVVADRGFYPAEAYHQNFLVQNPDQPYIAAYDMPRLEALARTWPTLDRPTPVLALARPGPAASGGSGA